MVCLTEQVIKMKTRLDKLDDVKNLNLWGQGLEDVSVLEQLPNVEVLSLSVNKIRSLRDFAHCTKLQELYLRKNEVADVNEIQHLAPLKDLRVLWLSDNPCADHPNYKSMVAKVLPHLQKLDNDDMDAVASSAGSARGPSPQAAASPSPYSAATPPVERAPSRTSPPSQQRQPRDPNRNTKNILYAVMALLSELEDEDLVLVRREVEQRLGE